MESRFRTQSGNRFLGHASEALRGARDARGLAEAIATYIDAAEREAVTGNEGRVACRAGCPHCCVLNVSVLPAEAAAIAFRLSQDLPPAGLAGLLRRLDDHRRRVRWMESGERVRCRIFCPFLDLSGSCTIHPWRPMACRGLSSLDLESCTAALDPADPDAPGFIPMDLYRKLVMEDAYLALAGAMERSGMESRCLELSAGVRMFLAEPDLCASLLTGGRIPSEVRE